MREILFQGKSVADGRWVEGSLFIGFGKAYICPDAIAMYYFDGALCLGEFVEVDPETVGQYTGLTDKNGKKIFEGDVCRFYWDEGYSDYVVFWDDTVSQWTVRQIDLGAKDVLDSYFAERCEVIGNILQQAGLSPKITNNNKD